MTDPTTLSPSSTPHVERQRDERCTRLLPFVTQADRREAAIEIERTLKSVRSDWKEIARRTERGEPRLKDGSGYYDNSYWVLDAVERRLEQEQRIREIVREELAALGLLK